MALALLLLGVYTYGMVRLGQDQFASGPIVCLLQSNLDQRIRDKIAKNMDGHSVETVREQFGALVKRASLNHDPLPDLIIWPESSFPGQWTQLSKTGKQPEHWREYQENEIEIRKVFHQIVMPAAPKPGQTERPRGIPHLIGINGNNFDENARLHRYNSALFIDAFGEVDGRFDKIHRVPFGEYVPFKDSLPFMKAFSVYDYDFSIRQGGEVHALRAQQAAFRRPDLLRGHRPVHGPPLRHAIRRRPAGRFLRQHLQRRLVRRICEHEEHLAVSRFRAIECRRAMVRAVNMGISAVIDGNGRILKPTPYLNTNPTVWEPRPVLGRIPDFAPSEWHTMKKKMGVLKATVPIDERFSLYVLAGDWLPIGCWGAILGGAAWGIWRRWRPTPACSPPSLAAKGSP